MDEPRQEPKQERAVKTRETILRAAAEVFDECGFSGASISKIMQQAGVTQGAMYFHFKSKRSLAQAVMVNQGDYAELPVGEDGGGLQGLIDMTFHLARELQRNVLFRAGVRLAVEQGEFGMRDATPYQLWVDQFHELLVKARADGDLLEDVDEQEFAHVLVGAYSGTQLFSQISAGRADLPERIASLWRYLLRAIAPPEVVARVRVRPPWQELDAA